VLTSPQGSLAQYAGVALRSQISTIPEEEIDHEYTGTGDQQTPHGESSAAEKLTRIFPIQHIEILG